MATRKPPRPRATFQESLERLSQRLAKSKIVKPGDIVFRLTGQGGGNFVAQFGEAGTRVVKSAAAGAGRTPLVEVIGDTGRIRAILAGEKDARKQFLAGGFRVRGDLRYVSDIALELGIIKEPF